MQKELEEFRVSSLRELQQEDDLSYETYIIDGLNPGKKNKSSRRRNKNKPSIKSTKVVKKYQ